ncbi:methyltransferase domain-containing protein [bacterium]|nr:methyltransferase domain-containing protein [bacterium]
MLDLGCGPGVWALLLAPQVESWTGFDISPHFIQHAQQEAQKRRFTHLDFRVGSLFEVEPDKTFNLIVLGGVLGYLQEPQLGLLLQRVQGWLEPHGLVYVRVSLSPGIYPEMTFTRKYPTHYRKLKFYLDRFARAGFQVTCERDRAFSEAILATFYTAAARWLGRTGMTAYRNAQKLAPISFGWAQKLLDLTPLPQSMQFVLSKSL